MGKIKGSFAKTYDDFIKRPNLLPGGLLELVRSSNAQSIVDFACGTGNIAVGLGLIGYDVTGVDYSPDMLRVARSKACRHKAKVHFVLGNIAKVNLGRTFDLLLCLGNTIPHFTNKKELELLLKNCIRHLRPGGIVIMQQLNYDRMVRAGSGTIAIDLDGEVVRFKQNLYNNGKVEFFVTIVDGQKIPPVISNSKTILKSWLKTELVEALGKAGFSKIKVFGSYRGESFGRKSKDLVLIGTL